MVTNDFIASKCFLRGQYLQMLTLILDQDVFESSLLCGKETKSFQNIQ